MGGDAATLPSLVSKPGSLSERPLMPLQGKGPYDSCPRSVAMQASLSGPWIVHEVGAFLIGPTWQARSHPLWGDHRSSVRKSR